MLSHPRRVVTVVVAFTIAFTGCSSDGSTAVSGVPQRDGPATTPGTPALDVSEPGPNAFGIVAESRSFDEPFEAALVSGFDELTVGAPNDHQNAFPFGGHADIFVGTRYQQAYSATQFTGLGTVLIRSISFLGGEGTLGTSNYSFSLSTISTGINALGTTSFDSNRGADNALFATMNLSGPAPSTLIIEGVVPFLYDPARGNLLLDIVVSPGAIFPMNTASYQARSGTAAGIFSRYHNFGFGNIGWGLVTRFELARPSVEDLGVIIDEAVTRGTLTGRGNGNSASQQLENWRRQVQVAERLAKAGNIRGACATLTQAYHDIDGQEPPPDHIGGTAALPLARFIQAILGELGC